MLLTPPELLLTPPELEEEINITVRNSSLNGSYKHKGRMLPPETSEEVLAKFLGQPMLICLLCSSPPPHCNKLSFIQHAKPPLNICLAVLLEV